MTIPHSNSFVEQQFSQVGIIKTSIRNKLEVATVSSLIKVKSYYNDIAMKGDYYEPQEQDYDHYYRYMKSQKL